MDPEITSFLQHYSKDALNKSQFVIPAQAGIQCFASIRFADCLLTPLQ